MIKRPQTYPFKESYITADPYHMAPLCNRRSVKPLPNLSDSDNEWRCLYAACFDQFWLHRRQFSLTPEFWDEAFMLCLTRAATQFYNKRKNGTSNEAKVGLYLAARSCIYSVFAITMKAFMADPVHDNKVTPMSNMFDDTVREHDNKIDPDDDRETGMDTLATWHERQFLSLAQDVERTINSIDKAFELYLQDCQILGLDPVTREVFEKRHIGAYYICTSANKK